MKPTPFRKSEAFTLIELIVVIIGVTAIGFAVAAMIFLSLHPVRAAAPRIQCVNNLKQIGTAYRIWSNDNGDRFPASQSVASGGWRELLTNADQGFLCWTNYAIMANEMGQSPKVVVCPADERQPAASFTNFANVNLSYFAGVSADDNQPQSLLGGDRNLGGGTKPDRGFGFSPKSGKGNDVAIQTGSNASPVCWSLKIHSKGNSAGAGNILLSDGSVQQVTSGNLRSNWQPCFGQTTNWPAGHVPSSPSIRVLFP
jgi:type II secretory pathway pseudopilin PulG